MRKGASRRRRLTVTALVASFAAVGGGCAQPIEQSIGFGPSDVAKMEVYVYAYGASGAAAQYMEVDDKRDIAQWVRFFDYLPLEPSDLDRSTLIGQEVAGFRFHLHEGADVEISQVFVGSGVLVVQVDGSRWASEYGAPFSDSLTDAEQVDVSDAPKIGA